VIYEIPTTAIEKVEAFGIFRAEAPGGACGQVSPRLIVHSQYHTTGYMIHKDREMSFEAVSERLKSLQDTNSQLRDLIDRLANINFQPGSIPLDDDENNVKVELTSEIHQIIKDQDEDLVILQEDIIDLGRKWASADLEQQKAVLDRGVKKALEDLKV
jgi:hypothetical protein